MELLLAGTGPASGFPVPGCSCATCRSPLAAAAPAELRIGDRYRLDVEGVLHGPDGITHYLRAGERLDLPGIAVRALPSALPGALPGTLPGTLSGTLPGAGRSVVLLVHLDDGPPLLWAPQAGLLADETAAELRGLSLGTAILGPAPEADPDDPQETSSAVECALTLARLRATGAAGAGTFCVLVGIGHRRGPSGRLAACLPHWRARLPDDGTRLTSGRSTPNGEAEIAPPGRTLVLGGSASGKSALAEDLLAAEPEVLYTATGPVVDLRTNPDAEWEQRVRRHRERRPAWWRTEETHEVAALLAKAEQPILLDSIGTWLTGVLDRAGAWQDAAGWRDRLGAETDALVRATRGRRWPLVAVSDEVGLSVVPATSAGRLFRDELGRLNRRLADESEQVLIVVAGRLLTTQGAAADQ